MKMLSFAIAAAGRSRQGSRAGIGLVLAWFGFSPVIAMGQAAIELSDRDRAEIQALGNAYASALGDCRAGDFADLFVAGTGFFASGFRGHMVGRARLIELVESERHCVAPPDAAQTRPGGRGGPEIDIVVDGDRALGIADLGSAQYQDEYRKTAAGWRFASRSVLIASELDAGLDADGLLAIHRLGGAQLGDYYEADIDDVPRLLTSGVRVSVDDGVVNGRVFLNDGSYRDEVYERLDSGEWRVRPER